MKAWRFIAVFVLAALIAPAQSIRAQAKAKPSVASLRKLLKDPDDQVRVKAAMQLGDLGPGGVDAVSDLVELYDNDKIPGVRIGAIGALGAIYFRGKANPPEKRAIAALGRALQDSDAIVRWSAAYALRGIGRGASEAAPELAAAIKDKKDPKLREFAALAMVSVAAPADPQCAKAAKVLMALHGESKDEDPIIESAILVFLGKIGANEDKVLDVLVEAYKNPRNSHSRFSAIRAMGYLGSKAMPAVPLLIDALKAAPRKGKGSGNVCNTVMRALERIGPDASAAIPLLEEISTDGNADRIISRNASKTLKAVRR